MERIKMKKEDNDNIIKFPKEKITTTANIQTQEDVLKQIADYKTSFANDVSEFLSQYIFGEMARSGVNFENQIDDLFPSMILVAESIQSLHLKSSGIHHALQDFAEDIYSDDEDEKEKTEIEEDEEIT